MRENFDFSLAKVLEWEGGWSDHPSDDGGATMKGITLATYKNYKKSPYTTKEQLHKITDTEVADIYRKLYWNAVRGDDMPSGIDFLLFDFGVNAGTGRSIKILQSCLKVQADGVIGIKTLGAVQSSNIRQIIEQFSDAKESYYKQCKNAKGEELFPIFGKGWMRRLEGNKSIALTMVSS